MDRRLLEATHQQTADAGNDDCQMAHIHNFTAKVPKNPIYHKIGWPKDYDYDVGILKLQKTHWTIYSE